MISASRAYRWGEEGLAGISDESRNSAIVTRWGGSGSPILKRRLFGSTQIKKAIMVRTLRNTNF